MSLKLLIVGEGERDNAAVPALTRNILGAPIEHQFVQWPRLFGAGKGFGKKLWFAMLQVQNRGLQGLVAVVDSDRRAGGRHLPKLLTARQDARAQGTLTPTALGEPIPHLEAWLLDDPVAVRVVLALKPSVEIAVPTKVKSPKEALNKHIASSACDKDVLVVIREIAEALDIRRCNQADKTGLRRYCADVQGELGSLAAGD